MIKSTLALVLLTLSLNMDAKTYSANKLDLDQANNGNTDAMIRIAEQFDPKKYSIHPVAGQAKDIEIAYEWYEKAADKANWTAQNWLCDYYQDNKDKVQSEKWFINHAEIKDYQECAAQWLGEYYFKQKEYSKAYYWLVEREGMDGAILDNIRFKRKRTKLVAEMYFKGIGTKQNYEKALEHYKSLTFYGNERNVSYSVENLARYYLVKAETQGKIINLDDLINKAERADNKFMQWFGVDLEPMKLLGAIYLLGDYPENRDKIKQDTNAKPDFDKARYWLEKYIALTNDPEVEYWLGKGLVGLSGNIKLLEKSAEQGYGRAAFQLGKEHYMGYNAIYDAEKAKHYAKLACENGVSDGCKLYKDINEYPKYIDLRNADIWRTDYLRTDD